MIDTTHYAEFGVNTPAFIDTFGGLVPCIVREVRNACNGRLIGKRGELLVEVTKTMAGYRKGERVEQVAAYTPPRKMIVRRQYSRRILCCYKYN